AFCFSPRGPAGIESCRVEPAIVRLLLSSAGLLRAGHGGTGTPSHVTGRHSTGRGAGRTAPATATFAPATGAVRSPGGRRQAHGGGSPVAPLPRPTVVR